MTAPKSLPPRPSLESLRKQAKKIARDQSLSLRDAQLALAREYGFAGWQDLTGEVSTRLGKGLEWAAAQARQIIHDNDVDGLKQLLAAHRALLSWPGNDWDSNGGLLGIATGAYGDAGDAQREEWFTRGACAELLLEAGAVVMPSVCEGLLRSRARGLLALFQRKGVLPRTMKFLAALGDLDAVRAALDAHANDLQTVNEAFVSACHFEQEIIAALLLERSMALDLEFGRHIDRDIDRASFIKAFGKSDFAQVAEHGLWNVFVIEQIRRTARDADLTAFVSRLRREPWLLDERYLWFQVEMIETASFNTDREEFIVALFTLDPAILRRQPPPTSRAIEWAFMYANTHLLPLLTRIWSVPDDLPHAAGMGDLARVKQWFDTAGVVRNVETHYPYNDPDARGHLRWHTPTAQQVLDVALAFAVTNRHYDVADVLLERGADINTRWNSHEPASFLHHLVFVHRDHEAMQFLIDRGIDMTIKDYRWNSTAAGWARYALNDETLAQWLEEQERLRIRGG